MFKLVLILLITTSDLIACEISLPDKIIFTSENTVKSFDLKHNCSNILFNKVTSFLSTLKGAINTKHLSEVLKEEHKIEVSFTPNSVELLTLSDITNNIIDPQNQRFEKLKIVTNKNIIFLSKDDTLKLECLNCNSTGLKNLKMIISNSKTQTSKIHWLVGTLTQKMKHLVAINNIAAGTSSLSSNDFKIEERYSSVSNVANIPKDDLKFYKANTHLKPGEYLKTSQITPINVVKRGVITNIFFSDNNIDLNSIALPMQNGKIGDIISLETLTTKKKISGMVVDFNKVKVNL